MRTKHELNVENVVIDIVSQLQKANFETYIVGGAIRDLLLGCTPKDYDISTSATPEEIRAVFGRKKARIIGKRFRLVHLTIQRNIYEISTFRTSPEKEKKNREINAKLPENMITSDNSFGTSEEDAWRRDFTVNALFYDPVKQIIIDYTKLGVEDIKNGVVRAIGKAELRFEEDPVRLLRALKLVGQYDFSLEKSTENALFNSLELLRHASSSRLSLELEKILASSYGDKYLEAFHDYGLLKYFLPHFSEAWGSEAMEYSLNLLNERNCRVAEKLYRNSISVAIASIALPFVERECNLPCGSHWENSPAMSMVIQRVLGNIFKPLNMINRLMFSAQRILEQQPLFENKSNKNALINSSSYSHSREMFIIRNECNEQDTEALLKHWPKVTPPPKRGFFSIKKKTRNNNRNTDKK